jgi:hypothetical protein
MIELIANCVVAISLLLIAICYFLYYINGVFTLEATTGVIYGCHYIWINCFVNIVTITMIIVIDILSGDFVNFLSKKVNHSSNRNEQDVYYRFNAKCNIFTYVISKIFNLLSILNMIWYFVIFYSLGNDKLCIDYYESNYKSLLSFFTTTYNFYVSIILIFFVCTCCCSNTKIKKNEEIAINQP